MTEWLAVALLTPILLLTLKYLRVGWLVSAVVAVGAAVAFVALRLTIMQPAQALTTTIFLAAYALIASERMHKTTVALAAAVFMLVIGLIHQEEAFRGADGIEGIDWNTIFLLIGMMVIVNIAGHTGVFQWVAIKAAKIAKGEPVAVMIMMSLVTALLSALLDNVTTVLLIAPVALLVCQSLAIDGVPMLVFVILASNIGGTATLIGDPPNIMIGSSARLGFLDFIVVNGPIIAMVTAAFLGTVWLVMRKRLHVTAEQRAQVMAFDESKAITDHRLLRRSLSVLTVTLIAFGFHSVLHLEVATIALAGAALMMLMHREGPEEALREVEWSTIFFFIGLFIMVSALVKSGVVGMMGQGILALTGDNVPAMTMLILWVSALVSGVVGSVPFVATGTVLIHGIATALHPEATTFAAAAHAPDVLPLWWALSLGACLGGNFTVIASAANLVVAGILTQAEQPVTFVRFMKYSVPITLQGLILSSVWLWLLFLR
ncbi:MAG: ArsB/NhaD family transporter [Armatimonadia bacterium]